ncbi:hypothetical protein L9F63_009878, partial [Diploptera punctata]
EIDLVTDPICLHSRWPWILQPQSQFLNIWNACILIVSLTTAILLPYYASLVCTPMKFKIIPDEIPSCPHAERAVVVQVISVIFFGLDVIVQILTAVRYKGGK